MRSAPTEPPQRQVEAGAGSDVSWSASTTRPGRVPALDPAQVTGGGRKNGPTAALNV